jgi:UDP-glucose 4-epimerase
MRQRVGVETSVRKNPVNIGSGKGVAIIELARRVMKATESKSRLEFVSTRKNEVLALLPPRARGSFSLAFPKDPLGYVEEVVSSFRTAVQEMENWL